MCDYLCVTSGLNDYLLSDWRDSYCGYYCSSYFACVSLVMKFALNTCWIMITTVIISEMLRWLLVSMAGILLIDNWL
mgnify:CR=1 FL=1